MKGKHHQADKRRNHIIQAGLTCFTENGFTKTTMAEICKTANASTGSVYHHYKSKEQLAIAVYIEGIKDFQEGFIDMLFASETAMAGIKSSVYYYLNWVKENPDWAKFLFFQRHADFMQEPGEEVNRLNVTFITKIIGWFKKYSDAGELKSLEWSVIVPLLLGPSQDYANCFLAGLPVVGIDEAKDTFADAAWIVLKK